MNCVREFISQSQIKTMSVLPNYVILNTDNGQMTFGRFGSETGRVKLSRDMIGSMFKAHIFSIESGVRLSAAIQQELH